LGHHIANIPVSLPAAPGSGRAPLRAAVESAGRRTAPALGVVQRVNKQGPGEQGLIDVVEDDFLPNCVLDLEIPTRIMYRRTGGIANGWNDTDLFYADGEGPLVQITTAMVNDYWDPKYAGFTQLSGPDWTVNCEDYAKAGGFGAEIGSYANAEELGQRIEAQRGYVLKLSFHWMRVAKTGDDAVTIQQKDGESAVYRKVFTLQGALTYILEKRSEGGVVYRND
jgi:hypothetical protein